MFYLFLLGVDALRIYCVHVLSIYCMYVLSVYIVLSVYCAVCIYCVIYILCCLYILGYLYIVLYMCYSEELTVYIIMIIDTGPLCFSSNIQAYRSIVGIIIIESLLTLRCSTVSDTTTNYIVVITFITTTTIIITTTCPVMCKIGS